MTPTTDLDAPAAPTRWDWWPLARLLIVLTVFGTFAHFRLGWTPEFDRLAAFPREVFEVFSLFTLLSFGLAHLYLVLLMLPVYACRDAQRHALRRGDLGGADGVRIAAGPPAFSGGTGG